MAKIKFSKSRRGIKFEYEDGFPWASAWASIVALIVWLWDHWWSR